MAGQPPTTVHTMKTDASARAELLDAAQTLRELAHVIETTCDAQDFEETVAQAQTALNRLHALR